MDDLSLTLLQLHAKGYNCSQILLLLGLDMTGRDNPDLVRAVGGLGTGMGGGQTCGVLSGAVCLVSYYAGKGADGEHPHDRLPLMISELVDWFRNHACGGYGGIRCSDILGEDAGTPDTERCGGLIAQAWNKSLELLQDSGIDPTQPPGEDHDW